MPSDTPRCNLHGTLTTELIHYELGEVGPGTVNPRLIRYCKICWDEGNKNKVEF